MNAFCVFNVINTQNNNYQLILFSMKSVSLRFIKWKFFFTEQCLKMSCLIETEAFYLFLLISNNVLQPHPFSRAVKGSTWFLWAICSHIWLYS